MNNNKPSADRGLRLAVRQMNETAKHPMLSDDFTDRLMQRVEQESEPHVVHRRWWLYASIGAVAASIAIVLLFNYNNKVDLPAQPKTAHVTLAGSADHDDLNAANVTNVLSDSKVPEAPKAITPSAAPRQIAKAPRHSAAAKETAFITDEIPDTLGSSIMASKENIARALQMLAECEQSIMKGEQAVRNDMIEATFNSMPQSASAMLVVNELGDVEVVDYDDVVKL